MDEQLGYCVVGTWRELSEAALILTHIQGTLSPSLLALGRVF